MVPLIKVFRIIIRAKMASNQDLLRTLTKGIY